MTTIFDVTIYDNRYTAKIEKLPKNSKLRYRLHVTKTLWSGDMAELSGKKFSSINEARIHAFVIMGKELSTPEQEINPPAAVYAYTFLAPESFEACRPIKIEAASYDEAMEILEGTDDGKNVVRDFHSFEGDANALGDVLRDGQPLRNFWDMRLGEML